LPILLDQSIQIAIAAQPAAASAPIDASGKMSFTDPPAPSAAPTRDERDRSPQPEAHGRDKEQIADDPWRVDAIVGRLWNGVGSVIGRCQDPTANASGFLSTLGRKESPCATASRRP